MLISFLQSQLAAINNMVSLAAQDAPNVLNATLINKAGKVVTPVIYVSSDPKFNQLSLVVYNYLSTSVILPTAIPSGAPIAFSISNILSQEETNQFATKSDNFKLVSSYDAPSASSIFSLSPTTNITILPNQNVEIDFSNFTALAQSISVGTLYIDVNYYVGSALQEFDTSTTIPLQKPDDPSKPELSTALSIILSSYSVYNSSSDGKCNFGISNDIKLTLTNLKKSGDLSPSGAPMASFYLSFVFTNANDPGALTDLKSMTDMDVNTSKVYDQNFNWLVQPIKDSKITYWQLKPQNQNLLGFQDSASVEFEISNIITYLPTGYTNLYLTYNGIPEYNDGTITVPINKIIPISTERDVKTDIINYAYLQDITFEYHVFGCPSWSISICKNQPKDEYLNSFVIDPSGETQGGAEPTNLQSAVNYPIIYNVPCDNEKGVFSIPSTDLNLSYTPGSYVYTIAQSGSGCSPASQTTKFSVIDLNIGAIVQNSNVFHRYDILGNIIPSFQTQAPISSIMNINRQSFLIMFNNLDIYCYDQNGNNYGQLSFGSSFQFRDLYNTNSDSYNLLLTDGSQFFYSFEVTNSCDTKTPTFKIPYSGYNKFLLSTNSGGMVTGTANNADLDITCYNSFGAAIASVVWGGAVDQNANFQAYEVGSNFVVTRVDGNNLQIVPYKEADCTQQLPQSLEITFYGDKSPNIVPLTTNFIVLYNTDAANIAISSYDINGNLVKSLPFARTGCFVSAYAFNNHLAMVCKNSAGNAILTTFEAATLNTIQEVTLPDSLTIGALFSYANSEYALLFKTSDGKTQAQVYDKNLTPHNAAIDLSALFTSHNNLELAADMSDIGLVLLGSHSEVKQLME